MHLDHKEKTSDDGDHRLQQCCPSYRKSSRPRSQCVTQSGALVCHVRTYASRGVEDGNKAPSKYFPKWDIGVGSCFFCFICADLGDGSIRGGMKRCDGVIGGGSKKLFLD
ncbi:hypothetical protein NC651_012032 [Populus alba x Populus x berolinensis]|nr:hypothetical protein NC651_012032 [Populus alba x Populus x berolinensis]